MAFADRSQIIRNQGSRHRAKELFAGILLGALMATLGMSYVLPADACDRDTAVYAWGGDGWSRAALPAQSAPRDGVRYRRGPDFCRRRCFYSDRAGPDGQAFHPFGSTRLTGSILRSFNCVVSEHARPRPGPSGSSSEL